jgi:predicted enzyme related to lactoylglutathione lyase
MKSTSLTRLAPRANGSTARLLCLAALFFASSPAPAADGLELPPLTDISSNPRLPGKFVWVDLATDNVARAQTFYARMFGWQFYDLGGYIIGLCDGRPLCGMFQKPKPADKPDAKPRWIGYISVANVGQAQYAVTEAGGTVVAPPGKFPKRGEQAVFADPDGAIFGVIKSSSGDPEDEREEALGGASFLAAFGHGVGTMIMVEKPWDRKLSSPSSTVEVTH